MSLVLPKPVKAVKERKRIRRRVTLGQRRREAKAQGDLTPEQWEAIVRAYGGLCAYCGMNRATEQDHIKPISRGGLHTASNCAPACSSCNAKKRCSRRWEPRAGHPFREAE